MTTKLQSFAAIDAALRTIAVELHNVAGAACGRGEFEDAIDATSQAAFYLRGEFDRLRDLIDPE